mmetsp:Transcript_60484/g.177395  ORF Transcript_60484/g.177395 Transcript_60484/m.177395 type:complete len:238 (+) Transcript_60484:1302-2015(+)
MTSLAHGSSVSGPLIGAGPKRLLNSASEIAPEPDAFTSAKSRMSCSLSRSRLYVSTIFSNSGRDREPSFLSRPSSFKNTSSVERPVFASLSCAATLFRMSRAQRSSELWGPKRLLNSPRLIPPEPETFTSAKRRCSWWAVDRGLYVSTSLSNSTRDRVSSWLSRQSRRRKTSSMLSPDRAGPRQALTVLRISRAHGSSTAEHALKIARNSPSESAPVPDRFTSEKRRRICCSVRPGL